MSDAPIQRVRGLNELPVQSPAPSESSAASRAAAEPPRSSRAVPIGPRASRDDDGPAPRREDEVDAEIDRALEGRQQPRRDPLLETNFKRQKDEDVEAELDSIMAGFNHATLQSEGGPRTRAQDRAHVPKPGVGQEVRPGVQRAKVVGIRGGTVFLDLGAKSEGVVPAEQFGSELPSVGDFVEVVFERYDPDEGLLIMSRQGAAVAATWANLRKGLVVEARVTKEIKGGVEVEVNGIRGFMPISQLDLNRVEDGKEFINQKLKCLVTEANERERNLVVSRRELLEKERAEQREKTWADLAEGQTRTGIVRGIKPFGVFVDLGGVDGLIPVGELSWSRVSDPTQVVKSGESVEVKVLRIDREAQKVTLGLRQLKPSPWDRIADEYRVGQTLTGKVSRLMDFGAFVELEPGIEGLIHTSELGPRKVWRVKDIVQPDQEVEVRILKIEPEAKRISLTLRPPEAAPVKRAEDEEALDEELEAAPSPKRTIPLKGGLGDRDPNPFGRPPL
jgi:small subunit ribosomal protein S1